MPWDTLDLSLEDLQAPGRLVHVQDEPALEIALPQVFEQPRLLTLQRGKLPHLESLIGRIYQHYRSHPEAGLGEDYQAVVNEFQPLFAWATSSWDFLLSTEGCRFVPRLGEQRYGIRGDYRVVTERDYSRIVHRHFRQLLLEYAADENSPSFSNWLRERFWPLVRQTYQALDKPLDTRQRRLTPYSYLRCVPYTFLNDYHQNLVTSVIRQLPEWQQEALHAYFLQFFTDAATAEALNCPPEDSRELLRQALVRLLVHERLVYCLLRQIERY
jgi:DNA-directed RNA polymerase specialized sigma24 family protein